MKILEYTLSKTDQSIQRPNQNSKKKIDIQTRSDSEKVGRFADYLTNVFNPYNDSFDGEINNNIQQPL